VLYLVVELVLPEDEDVDPLVEVLVDFPLLLVLPFPPDEDDEPCPPLEELPEPEDPLLSALGKERVRQDIIRNSCARLVIVETLYAAADCPGVVRSGCHCCGYSKLSGSPDLQLAVDRYMEQMICPRRSFAHANPTSASTTAPYWAAIGLWEMSVR
jgi:hypothetical protein